MRGVLIPNAREMSSELVECGESRFSPEALARWSAVSGPGESAGSPPPSGDDDARAELERLRVDLARAQEEAAAARADAAQARAEADRAKDRASADVAAGSAREDRRRSGRWRTPVAALLVLLGSLLAPLALAGVWVDTQVSDTDRYVETVAPLARNPAVQAAVAAGTTDAIFARLDIDEFLDRTIDSLITTIDPPPFVANQLRDLAGTMSYGIRSFVQTRINKVVRSDRFATAWDKANRVAHEQLVNALSGEQGGAVVIQGDTVRLQLGPFIEVAKQDLAKAGFTRVAKLPTINPSIELAQSSDLARAQGAYTLLNRLGIVLPLLSVALLGCGVVVARRRRRMLLAAGLGLAGGMVLLAVALAVGRAAYLGSLTPDGLPVDAAAAIFDTLVRFLREALWAFVALGLVIALGAFVTGPSRIAAGTRSRLSTALGWLRQRTEALGVRTGPVGPWVRDHAQALRIVVVAAAAVTLVVWHQVTVQAVVLLAGIVLVALAIVEFLAHGVPRNGAPRNGAPTSAGANDRGTM